MLAGAARPLAVAMTGIVGLSIGSFLNVVIYRMPRGLSLAHPRSHCPSCKARLGALDNVPVLSWLILRGRCRSCSARISARYPIVELITALCFVATVLALGALAPLASLGILEAIAIAAAAIELDDLAVPRGLGFASGGAVASLLLVTVAEGGIGRLGWALAGALAMPLVLAGSSALAAKLRCRTLPASWTAGIVVTGLAFGAGWLWPPGGIIFAGSAALVTLVGIGCSSSRRARRPNHGALVRSHPMVVCSGVGLVLILAGARLGGA